MKKTPPAPDIRGKGWDDGKRSWRLGGITGRRLKRLETALETNRLFVRSNE
jgi:hypothetical protein